MTALDTDRRAWFEEQVLDLLPELHGTALRLTKGRADAEDLVADAVCKAWESLGTLREPKAFRHWLHRILSNTYISQCRTCAARTEHESLDAAGEHERFSLFERLHQPFLLWWGNPEQDFLRKLMREDLERSVDALPDPYRVVVVMADVQGFGYRDIAEALEVPLGTVKSRLARGRSLLQRDLWTYAEELGWRTAAPEPPPPASGGER